MKDRAAHVTPTRDFNRPYRDIVDKRGPWTMEEWIHWTEAWSPYILADHQCAQTGRILHDPRLRQMWSLLHQATLHHVRAVPGNGTPEQQQAAHENLRQYAKLVSQHFGIKALLIQPPSPSVQVCVMEEWHRQAMLSSWDRCVYFVWLA